MNLTNEERSALERVRKFLAGDKFSYNVSDERVLRDAMLRLFPADDEEPITEEWLRSIGWAGDDFAMFSADKNRLDLTTLGFGFCCFKEGDEQRRCWVLHKKHNPRTYCIDTDSIMLPTPQTRGQLRRLLSALGIAIKEQS